MTKRSYDNQPLLVSEAVPQMRLVMYARDDVEACRGCGELFPEAKVYELSDDCFVCKPCVSDTGFGTFVLCCESFPHPSEKEEYACIECVQCTKCKEWTNGYYQETATCQRCFEFTMQALRKSMK